MIKNKSALILAGLLACASAVSYAKDGGGHGGNGGGAGGGAGGGMGGGDRGAASGKAGAGSAGAGSVSSQHMSSEGAANTNSPDSANRAKGLARAEDRMSTEGLEHQKADQLHNETKSDKSVKMDATKKDISPQHLSSEGAANTNSVHSADQDKGLARANDRTTTDGVTHAKADKTLSKSKASKSLKPDTVKKE